MSAEQWNLNQQPGRRTQLESMALKVLIVEDNPGDVDLVREILGDIESMDCTITHRERLAQALDTLAQDHFDIVLLDLSLPDSQGLDTYEAVRTNAPELPILILTGLDDEQMALEMVQAGAQDYILKNRLNSNMLQRIIRYAIERQQLLTSIRSLSLTDELTGLYNRRGFITLAEQQLKVADRLKLHNRIFLIFIDMDKMKWINDTFSHKEGDKALQEVGEILQQTFRRSDIIARLGGDEFVVLAVEITARNSVNSMQTRLYKHLEEHNQKPGRQYELSFSTGIVTYDPDAPSPLDELLTRADKLMYEQKQARQVERE